jgi:hypothetical protein
MALEATAQHQHQHQHQHQSDRQHQDGRGAYPPGDRGPDSPAVKTNVPIDTQTGPTGDRDGDKKGP